MPKAATYLAKTPAESRATVRNILTSITAASCGAMMTRSLKLGTVGQLIPTFVGAVHPPRHLLKPALDFTRIDGEEQNEEQAGSLACISRRLTGKRLKQEQLK